MTNLQKTQQLLLNFNPKCLIKSISNRSFLCLGLLETKHDIVLICIKPPIIELNKKDH